MPEETTEIQTPEPIAPEPGAEPSVTETPEGGAAPDLSEQYQDLAQRMAKIEEGQPTATETAQPTDLLTALMGEPAQPEPVQPQPGLQPVTPQYTQQDLEALHAAGYDIRPLLGQGEPADPRDQRIDELAQQVEAMNEREVDSRLNALTEKYEDIMDPKVLGPMQQRLQGLAQRHGDQVLTDPDVVETTYQAVKAQQADAAAAPAQQAATSGATLETGAGRTQAGGEDPSAQYAEKLYSVTGGSVFTQ